MTSFILLLILLLKFAVLSTDSWNEAWEQYQNGESHNYWETFYLPVLSAQVDKTFPNNCGICGFDFILRLH